jgi:hypothetical protein
MIGPPRCLGEVSSCEELATVLRSRQDELQLSNQFLDYIIPVSEGHTNKILGPARSRGLTALSLNGLLSALALRPRVVEDPAQLALMRPRYEQRDAGQVRASRTRIAKEVIKRAKPAVVRALGRSGGLKTWRMIDPRLRSQRMRELAKRRWGAKRSASAPEPQ